MAVTPELPFLDLLVSLGLVFSFGNESLTYRLLAKLSDRFRLTFKDILNRVDLFCHFEPIKTSTELVKRFDFTDRPVKESAYWLLFHGAMDFISYRDYLRSLKRILPTHLFILKRIASFRSIGIEPGSQWWMTRGQMRE
ncbi:hypothetical protein PanWU01x14_164870 [Parasponia andersonii]|uniref:Uncharacterized protein n=1 Tax=Parasponia andersonii TaxID=3476 RepID=A0A2P5CCJ9_PARAD|nr:hypothetical protein PanWU01x14_164870 [Parasponia andersonii]